MRRQINRRLTADMTNADCRDETCKWRIFAGLNIIDEFMCGDFRKSVEFLDLTSRQSI